MQASPTTMSWISPNTGRPKEDGGHQRINISADENTRQVLDHVENKSVFIETCIRDFTQHKVVTFFEAKEAKNSCRTFKDAAVFEFRPIFNDCKIEEVNLSFNYYSPDDEIEFRLCINANKGLVLTESSPDEYTLSHAYSREQLFGKPIEAMLRGKDKYIFRLQFRAVQNSEVYVKMVRLYVHVFDTPLTDSNYQEKPKKRRRANL